MTLMFEFLTTTFGSTANAVTLFIVIVLAVERLIKGGYLNLRLGKNGLHKKDNEEQPEHVPQWAQQLAQHFNHETTETLNTILSGQRSMCQKMDGIQRTLDEFKEYGIKIRNGNSKK